MDRLKDAQQEVFTKHEALEDTDTTIKVSQSFIGSEAIMIYLDYVKGDENGLVLTFTTNILNQPNKEYAVSYLDGDDKVLHRSMTIENTGTYRIPVSVLPLERNLNVIFTFDGGSDGNRGTVEAFIHP
jgi:hypothetical protein